MTAATDTVLGVVLQVRGTTPITSHFDDVPGAPTGTLQLGALDGSGVTVVLDDALAVERTLDQLQHLHHAFSAGIRSAQEDAAWAEHDRAALTDRGRAAVAPLLQLVRA